MSIPERVAAIVFLTASLFKAQAHLAIAQSSFYDLKQNFISPPETAKPRVWWHWMNGNITKDGIKLDLEWMRRIGLGGLQTFDAAYDTPKVVDERLVFMTAPWKDAFRFTATMTDQLGLELAIAGSPGWSESGGPWVKPEQGMKKLVWTEIRVIGGRRFIGKLPRPPSTVGPFQDVPVARGLLSLAGPDPIEAVPDFYRDVAVIGYPLTAEDRPMAELQPKVTSSAGSVEVGLMWDGHYDRAVHLPYGKEGNDAWIQLDLGHPQTVQSMILSIHQPESVSYVPKHISAELQYSSDGSNFRHIANAYNTAEDSPAGLPPVRQTLTFAPVKARYFRLVLPTPPAVSPALAAVLPPADTEHQVMEFVLSPTPRVDHVEQKAAFFLDTGLNTYQTRHVAARDVINLSRIVNLTHQLRQDGTLDWTPPPGRWAIVRVGYSLLGITNHPASPEGTGLEVDKLSRSAVRAHMDDYLGRYESIVGPYLIGSHGLRAMINDSYEAGAQNWTDELPSEFARRRGYDLYQWLPALTGRIVNSSEMTDQFLWDFRRTLGELLTENHYGQISASLHSHGMIHYGESHEINRAFIGDGMDAKRDNDIPMAAMWIPDSSLGITQEQGDADIRESASVAHIYGQNLVAAESMTALGGPGTAFGFSPETLKSTVDRELADGLNLFVIHTSVHQALADKPPGLTLGPYGQWFTRNETWAEDAGPWIKYLARSSYLLQQGHFVADVVYYYGQDSNVTALFGDHLPPVPEGYAFDFASAHALTKLSAQDGYLVSASGMRYRILVLDPRARVMSLDVLKTIAHLVYAGATVVGDKPLDTPSLSDDGTEFRELARMLWREGATGEYHYGRGRILSGLSIAEALERLRIGPDFQYSRARGGTGVWYVHRQLADGDLYFLNNRQGRAEYIQARFRVRGRAPELWHADSGAMEPLSYREEGDRTIVPLHLDPNDAVFVVFRKPMNKSERTLSRTVREPLYTLGGPWDVHFQKHRGAPERTVFTELHSWTANSDVGIKYFSGTASYEKTFEVPASWLVKGESLEIDLGSVKNLGEVVINGMSAGVLWKPPFRADITRFVHAGTNRLGLRVTNLWPNRLIGDKQPGSTPVAATTFNPYAEDSPLLPSGLLGPVQIMRVRALNGRSSGDPGERRD